MAPTAPPRRWAAYGALLVAVTLLTYLPAITAGFIWNDRDYVTAPALRSLDGLRRIWCELGATEQYYPMLHSFFWLQHRLWGDAPAGYHVTNILLHAAAAGLLVAIVSRLRIPGAWLAGFIFAVHPVYVESVAWISEQKNTLSTVLYLLAALLYLKYDATRRLRHYWAALFVFVVALLSKSVTATLPPALLVLCWWQRGRLEWRRDVRPLAAWFALGAAVGLFSGWVEREYIGAYGRDFALSGIERLLIAGRAAWFYPGKLVWPADLMFFYPRWRVDSHAVWQFGFPAAAIAALAVLWTLRRRTRAPLAAALFFVGSLFPVLGFLNVYAFIFSFVADHWQYEPSIGLVVIAAAGLTVALAGVGPPIRRGLAIAMLAAFAVLSFGQTQMYRDVEVFYRTILSRNPDAWLAHNNLGVLLEARGEIPAAEVHVRTALRLKPDFAEAYNTLGTVLLAQPARAGQARTCFEKAIELEPRFAQAHSNLGIELVKFGRRDEGIAHLEQAVRLDPRLAETAANAGFVLASTPGRENDAVPYYERALAIDPTAARLHNDFAALLAKIPGRSADAITHYEEAIRLNPDYAEAHNNLANLLARMPGGLPRALDHYEQALRVNPNFAAAHYNLANRLAELPDRSNDAMAHYEAALRIDPNFALAHLNLANALAALPTRQADAIAHYLAALQLEPGAAVVRKNLAVVYARNGRIDDAIRQIEAVLAAEPNDEEARSELERLRARQR